MLKTTIKKHVENFLEILGNENTRKSYAAAFRAIFASGILNRQMNTQAFSTTNANRILDRIKLLDGYAESTRQQYAASFVSFTRYLNRKTKDLTPVANPDRFGVNKTFFKIRDKVTTIAIEPDQVAEFIDVLSRQNEQHGLIASITYIGAKRISEVINLEIEDVQPPEILFTQSKTRGTDRKTVITYPPNIFEELKIEITDRDAGHVFTTTTGEPLNRLQLNRSFASASRELDFKVTPHVLRASAITEYFRKGMTAAEISIITGTTEETVKKYDKRSLAENITRTNPLPNFYRRQNEMD